MSEEENKAPQEDDGGPEVPKFIVTFADMITLLVTFFILMLTFSTPRSEQLKLAKGSLSGAFGIEEDAITPAVRSRRTTELQQAVRGTEVPARVELDHPEEDAQALIRDTKEAKSLDIEATDEGIRIRIPAQAIFRTNSARLTESSKGPLKSIADLLRLKPYEAIIEGHTDQGFKKTFRFRSAEAMGAARATAVADFLIRVGRVDSTRIGVCTYGDAFPRVDNDTPVSRKKNRRVEILLRPLRKEGP